MEACVCREVGHLGEAQVVIRNMTVSLRGLDLHSEAMGSLRLYGRAKNDEGGSLHNSASQGDRELG